MSNSDQPLVSILTPVYNGADFLDECIESVLKQTHRNFEYIIVNNCSKDRSLEIIREWAKKDDRIRVHDNVDFLPVIANHNHAFRMISRDAKYCKIVSGDDWVYPECIEKMVALAERHPSVGVVGAYSIAGTEVLYQGLEYEKEILNGRDLCRSTLLGGPYVFGAPTSLMYRADLVRRVKEFYPNPNPHSDLSAVYASLADSDFGFVHQILSYTRIHTESQTSRSFKFGRINRALFANVAHFGPLYLSKDEYRRQLRIMSDKYYRWLVASALIEHSFSGRFIQDQKTGLQELGIEFSMAKVAKASLMRIGELVRHPGVTARKIASLAGKRGKVIARNSRLTGN